MKIYPKNLTSLEALRKEKLRLQRIAQKNAPSTWLSGDGAGKSGEGSQGILEQLGSSVWPLVSSFAPQILQLVTRRSKKKPLFNFAKDFIGGYIKWKVLFLLGRKLWQMTRKNRPKNAGT